jgi:hypothetical protein
MNTTTEQTTTLILAGEGYQLTIAPEAEARKHELLAAASAVTAVTSNEDSAAAQFQSRRLAALRIEVEKSRKLVKEPVNRIGKLIDKTAGDFIESVDAEEKRINRLVGQHAAEVARLKAEKEAEERRAFEEARAAREAAEAAAAAAADTGKISDIVAARQAEAVRQEALAARMDASEEVAETNVAQGVRFAWDFEVEDIHTVYQTAPQFVSLEIRRAAVLSWLKEIETTHDNMKRAAACGILAFKKPVVSSR